MGAAAPRGPQWLQDYRDHVGAPNLQSAVSVSAGWSVFAMEDGAFDNTKRRYPPLVARSTRVSRVRAKSGDIRNLRGSNLFLG